MSILTSRWRKASALRIGRGRLAGLKPCATGPGLVRSGAWSLAVATLLFARAHPAVGQTPSSNQLLDQAFEAYWAARGPDELARASEAVLAPGAGFAEVWSRLKAGRPYSGEVPTGRRLLSRRNADGVEHDYVALIPREYDAARPYAVRVYLHGGVMRPPRPDGQWWPNHEALARTDSIVVFPASWAGSLWWQASQIENLAGILNELKRTYNVDENRAFLLGVSDGATGAYYHAFQATTPWAGFLPFNGHALVLGNPSSDVDGEMHVPNLTNKPLFVVNGTEDRLYPAESVARYIRLFSQAGVDVDFRPQIGFGHTMRWWPRLAASIDSFIDSNPRQPLPDRLIWETERTDLSNRAHWLLITELGPVEGERGLQDFNSITRAAPRPALGVNMLGEMDSRPGVRVIQIGPGSVADEAGLRAGDIILEVNGLATADVQAFQSALKDYGYGSVIPMVIEREEARQPLTLRFPEADAEVYDAFPRRRPAGRVELEREGNTITSATRGVRRYTLLLSPDQFDFSQPVTVITNGLVSFQGVVTPDIEVLLKWSATDKDRTMLFGAELEIEVGSNRP